MSFVKIYECCVLCVYSSIYIYADQSLVRCFNIIILYVVALYLPVSHAHGMYAQQCLEPSMMMGEDLVVVASYHRGACVIYAIPPIVLRVAMEYVCSLLHIGVRCMLLVVAHV